MDPRIRLTESPASLDTGAVAATPRDAASVVLIRDGERPGAGAIEVYLLRRHRGMAFAGGMAVFPGGGIDPGDFGELVDWVGPSPAEWASVFGTTPEQAQALVFAAVRETFEEAGVLLAGTADAVLEDVGGVDWEEDRRRLAAHETTLREVLATRGLLVRGDLLTPFAHWVTPEFEPRRYNTWFLAARLPVGQHTRDVSTESVDVVWLSVDAALRAADERSLLVLPPQYCVCLELYGHGSVAEVFGVERVVPCIQPTVAVDDDGVYLALPADLVELGLAVGRRMHAGL